MGFSVFRTVMTVLIGLFLLALFWFPSQYLLRLSEQLQAEIDDAETALLSSDPDAAKAHCAALGSLYEQHEKKLERFLNHACIDDFGSAIAVADRALAVGDTNTALAALAEAESLLARIRGIELFSPNSLL